MNNAGTFIKSGSGTSNISAAFNNTGIVDVQAGTLNLSGGNSTNVPTTDVGATYTTSTGSGTLQFSGGTRTLNNTSQITTTNVTFSGSQTHNRERDLQRLGYDDGERRHGDSGRTTNEPG